MGSLTHYVASLLACACFVAEIQPAAATGVYEAGFVPLGGIDQWVTIRGNDNGNPVLLVIHGGPGDVLSPYVDEFELYQNDFVVVQWDQRGAGRTYSRYRGQTPDLTLQRVAQDGIELTRYLTEHLEADEIYVLGHSWGSLIAAEMVSREPRLFTAYVGTGQISNWRMTNQAQYDYLATLAESDEALRSELALIGLFDPENPDHARAINGRIRRNLNASDAAWLGNLLARARELLTPAEFQDTSDGMGFSGRAYRAVRVDLFSTAPRLELPVVVIQGRHDLFTPTEPALAWFDELRAPQKVLFVIEDAGHFALVTHQTAFLESLLAARRELGVEPESE
jgi:pimeloyl-ACP methyl ester carboxylesterase